MQPLLCMAALPGSGQAGGPSGPSAPSTHSRWRHHTRLRLPAHRQAPSKPRQSPGREDPPWGLQVEGLVRSWSNQIRATTAPPVKPRRTLIF